MGYDATLALRMVYYISVSRGAVGSPRGGIEEHTMKRREYDRLVKLVGNLASEGAAREFARIADTLVDESRYIDGIRKFCDRYGEIVVNELRKSAVCGMVDGNDMQGALEALDVHIAYAKAGGCHGYYSLFRMAQGVDFDYNDIDRPIRELSEGMLMALCSNVFYILADMGMVERMPFKKIIGGSIRHAWRICD